MPRRCNSWLIPLSVSRLSHLQCSIRSAKRHRLCCTPHCRGSRRTTCKSASLAVSCSGCRGGKSGLAPSSFANEQALDALSLVAILPLIDGIGLVSAQEQATRHFCRLFAIGNLEQSCCSLTQIGTLIMIPIATQFLALLLTQVQGAMFGHGTRLLSLSLLTLLVYPI